MVRSRQMVAAAAPAGNTGASPRLAGGVREGTGFFRSIAGKSPNAPCPPLF
nr:MAG TPA: hypothetical protein [Caudoviricetes sp.]